MKFQEVFLFIAVTFSIASGHKVFIKFCCLGTATSELTVTLHSAFMLSFSQLIAYITAFPCFTAVILPVESTVATFVFEDLYFTFLLSAFFGNTVALNLWLSPLDNSILLSESLIDVT